MYEPLVSEIARFFRTGKPPVSAEETLDMFASMEAADESKRRGGSPVSLESVLEEARRAAATKRGTGEKKGISQPGTVPGTHKWEICVHKQGRKQS